uniref:Shugoshin C-terminal domain-containing protein n=1 Tax=Oryza punctata TaxID=4537 RepID=A0A0E0M8C2_ORYPU
MEAASLALPVAAEAAAAAAAPGRRGAAGGVSSIPRGAGAAARRKTLCDITNLRPRPPAAVEQDGATCAADGVAQAQLVKARSPILCFASLRSPENSELVRLLEEREYVPEITGFLHQFTRYVFEWMGILMIKIIELSGTELQKLRLANWQLAQANSQMLAELNLGRDRLKKLQHQLACSRAVITAKTSELEEAKKAMKRNRNLPEKAPPASETAQQQQGSDRAAQIKDGDVVNPEPAAASDAASTKKLSNASRKRMQRSRSLGPAATTKLASAPKEKENVQRRKSMRTPVPQPSEHREDLFEIEDLQLAIVGGDSKAGIAAASDPPEQAATVAAQFPRRSSLGRPIRRATERVASYKEMPVNIKLRRS